MKKVYERHQSLKPGSRWKWFEFSRGRIAWWFSYFGPGPWFSMCLYRPALHLGVIMLDRKRKRTVKILNLTFSSVWVDP